MSNLHSRCRSREPEAAKAPRLQCRHIFTDGRRCGSPALKGETFCYYHGRARRSGPRQPQVKTLTDRKASTFDLPSPADLAERPGLQLALAQVLHKIAHNEIDPRRAGLLLYGLQIASMNLGRPAPVAPPDRRNQPELVDEVTSDPELGTLAPEAEVDEEILDTRGSAYRILEEVRRAVGYVDDEDKNQDTCGTHTTSPVSATATAPY